MPAVDESGDQLLKHARVYTLAEKFGVEKLKSLATSKIHCVNSTAKGEIAYARYVYAYTNKDDTSIRAPVANFWATRSHTLRSEAEGEFRSLCLEYPQFGYDVLSTSARFLPIHEVLLTPNSSCAGRETQARKPVQVAPRTRKRAQTTSAQPNLEVLRVCWIPSFIAMSRFHADRGYVLYSELRHNGVAETKATKTRKLLLAVYIHQIAQGGRDATRDQYI